MGTYWKKAALSLDMVDPDLVSWVRLPDESVGSLLAAREISNGRVVVVGAV
jgi:hypothetical protein